MITLVDVWEVKGSKWKIIIVVCFGCTILYTLNEHLISPQHVVWSPYTVALHTGYQSNNNASLWFVIRHTAALS